MNTKDFKKLVEAARKDSAFFHQLVFNPEKAITKLDYLDRETKGAIVATNPEELIGRLTGELAWCGNTCTSSCDNTCGGSCGFTTNRIPEALLPESSSIVGQLAGCGNTCTSSCNNTCGQSCGYTTNRSLRGLEAFDRF